MLVVVVAILFAINWKDITSRFVYHILLDATTKQLQHRVLMQTGPCSELEIVQKVVVVASSFIAFLGFGWALLVYSRNRRLEQSKWASNLYEKFYETDHHKKIRDLLDSDDD